MSTDRNPPATAAVDARRRRFLRPLLIGGGLIVLLPVLIAAGVALLLPTETVGRIAAQKAEQALGVPVSIGEVDIDFWPVPSVALVESRLGPQDTPVAQAERILLRPRLLPLLSGRVTVREIVLDRPDIRLLVDSSGVLNLPFSSDSTSTEPDASGGASVEFAIDEFSIRDGRVSYQDARDGTVVTLSALEQELRMDGSVEQGELARIGLQGRIASDSVDAEMPDRLGAPLRGVRFALQHDAQLDRVSDLLEVSALRLELQRLALTGSGRIEAVSDSVARTADLTLGAEEFSFEDLARSLPEGFLQSLLANRDTASAPQGAGGQDAPPPAMSYAGIGAIQARVTGRMTTDSIPRVTGSIQLRGVALSRDDHRLLSGTAGTIVFDNDTVEGRDLSGDLFGSPFTLGFRVENLAAPVATFSTRGTANVGELLALSEGDEGVEASGMLPFDLNGVIHPDAPAASRVEGTINVDRVTVRTPSLLQPVQLSGGRMRFAGEDLRVEDLSVAFGDSRAVATASVGGWLETLLGDSTSIAVVRFDADAATLDLDGLLGPSESTYTPLLFARLADRPVNGKSAAEAAAELGFSLPELPRVRATGTLRADRLVRNGLTYQDLEVDLESSPSAVSVPHVRFGLMGGTVNLGLALERSETDATVVAVYHLENVGAEPFFSRFTPFQGHLSGLMSLDGEVSLQLDEHLLPVRPTVRSAGQVAFTSGSLTSWPLLGKVGERLGLQRFDTLAFREWSGEFLLAGPLVSLERSVQSSDRVRTELAGSFDFAGRLDLGLIARLSPALAAGAGEQVRLAAETIAGEEGSVPVGLRITGTVAEPSIAVDLSAAREEALARARERATEEAESTARRATSELARRALGDSTAATPAGIGEAVREEVQDRIRGLFGRRSPAPSAPAAESDTAAAGAGGGVPADSAADAGGD